MDRSLIMMNQYHGVFSLEDEERGEEFSIDTGEQAGSSQNTILCRTRDCHTVKKDGRQWSNTAVTKSLG